MRKILYLIIAFLFCAECDNGNQQNEYNDGKFTIIDELIFIEWNDGNIRDDMIDDIRAIFDFESGERGKFHIGNIKALYRHLYNNGHILFRGNQVNNIGDLRTIVEDRYRIKKYERNDPRVIAAVRRPIISYIRVPSEDPIEYQNGHAVRFRDNLFDDSKVRDNIRRLGFSNDSNIFNKNNRDRTNMHLVEIRRLNGGGFTLVIDVRMRRNNNWMSVIDEWNENRNDDDNEDRHFDIQGAQKLRIYITKVNRQAPFLATAFVEG